MKDMSDSNAAITKYGSDRKSGQSHGSGHADHQDHHAHMAILKLEQSTNTGNAERRRNRVKRNSMKHGMK
jgi:hypothetical protein